MYVLMYVCVCFVQADECMTSEYANLCVSVHECVCMNLCMCMYTREFACVCLYEHTLSPITLPPIV